MVTKWKEFALTTWLNSWDFSKRISKKFGSKYSLTSSSTSVPELFLPADRQPTDAPRTRAASPGTSAVALQPLPPCCWWPLVLARAVAASVGGSLRLVSPILGGRGRHWERVRRNWELERGIDEDLRYKDWEIESWREALMKIWGIVWNWENERRGGFWLADEWGMKREGLGK